MPTKQTKQTARALHGCRRWCTIPPELSSRYQAPLNARHHRPDQYHQRRFREQYCQHHPRHRTGQTREFGSHCLPRNLYPGIHVARLVPRSRRRNAAPSNRSRRSLTPPTGITAIVGTVRPSDLTTGRRLYNSAAVIRDQKLLGFADKTLLPEYDVFDDPRYFQPSAERHLFSLPDNKTGRRSL